MTLQGPVRKDPTGLIMLANVGRPAVLLAPLQAADKVQIDQQNGITMPLPASEAAAYSSLTTSFATADRANYSITGPIKQLDSGYVLEVRTFLKL